jgi:hypothetical protein
MVLSNARLPQCASVTSSFQASLQESYLEGWTSVLTLHTPAQWVALELVPARIPTASKEPSNLTTMTAALSSYHLAVSLPNGG